VRQLCCGILFLLLASLPLPAADILLPGEEAPEALFESKIGDAEVDFFLSGFWKTSLSGDLGLLFKPGGVVLWDSFPGLETEVPFRNVANLNFSVWLQRRYFLEVAVIGDIEKNLVEDLRKESYFRLGYLGKEDEFLQRLIIGSRNIGIAPFSFLEVPATGESSLGVEALLRSGSAGSSSGDAPLLSRDPSPRPGDPSSQWGEAITPLGTASHHLLLRWDNNEADSLSYLGKNLVSEAVIPLDQYLQGRFFKLPDKEVEDLEVFLQDADGAFAGGDGLKYRKVELSDGVLDSQEGLVSLKQPAAGRVLAYYRKGALEIGAPGLGSGALPGTGWPGDPLKIDLSAPKEDFSWDLDSYLGQDMADRKVTVAGKTCLRLWEPGEFSPFEILGSYGLPQPAPSDLSKLRVRVIVKGDKSETRTTPVSFRLTPQADWFTAYRTSDLRGDLENLVPFLDAHSSKFFDKENLLYGPARDASGGYLGYELLASFLTPVGEYRLGEDLIQGSIQVLRNGVLETRYEVDYSTGVITFLLPIGDNDRLDISFRRKQSMFGNGDLLFVWGNIIPLNEGLTLELATGLRWNSLPGSYSEKAYSRTGTVIGSATLKGEGERLRFSAAAGVAYTNPDTTGIMRLLSMEGEGLALNLSEDLAYPARAPDAATPFFPALDPGNRGRLLYKDYRSYGPLGTSSLMPYDWSPPGSQIFPYTNGSKPGPYNAAGSSQGSGKDQSLVLDYELEAGEWVGAQVLILPAQGLADLSGLRSVSISYRGLELKGTVELYLQIGEIGEDLDGDGVLDEEASATSSGFNFNDTGNGVVLMVGGGPKNQGNNRRDSEDVDGNGFLDGEALTATPAAAAGVTVQANAPTDTWQVYMYPFDESERQLLRRSRSLRLLVRNASGLAASGRILVDRISLAGSRFFASTSDSGGTVTAREMRESDAAPLPTKELEDVFPIVRDTFHPYGEVQEVLEVFWSGIGAGKQWQVQGYTLTGSEGIDYRTVVLYLRIPNLDPVGTNRLNFQLLDSAGRGVSWSMPPSILPGWTELSVSLDKGKVYLNGSEVAGAAVSEDSHHGSLVLFKLSQEVDTAGSGTLYLDELHLKDPKGAVGAALSLNLDLALPGDLVLVGDYALLRDLSLREEAFFASRGFSTLYGKPAEENQMSSLTETSFGLGFSDWRVDLLVETLEDELTLSGGHRVTVPSGPSPVSFSDAYSLRERDTGRSISRENELRLTPLEALSLDLDARASSQEDLLTQSWAGALSASAPRPLFSRLALMLQSAEEGYSPGRAGYLESWLQGYGLLLPWREGTAVERRGEGSLELELGTKPLGARLSGGLGFQSFRFEADTRRQKNALELALSLPLDLKRADGGAADLALEPGYRRKLQVLQMEEGLGDFAWDLEAMGRRLGSQSYAFSQPPFLELFSGAAAEEFRSASSGAEEAAYTPEAFLTLTRSFGSRLRDLFLPSRLEISVDRELRKEADLFDSFNNYRFKAQVNALNLFGAFGAYPLFSFYRMDDFSAALTVAVAADPSEVRSSSILLEHFLSLEGQAGNLFTLQNRLELTSGDTDRWSDTAALLYRWFRYPAGGVRLPLLPPKVSREGYFGHRESLELKLAGEKEALSTHPFNLILGHETAITYPDHGYLRAELTLGLDWESEAGGEGYFRLGARALIEAKIQF